jgi:hypothetical protein
VKPCTLCGKAEATHGKYKGNPGDPGVYWCEPCARERHAAYRKKWDASGKREKWLASEQGQAYMRGRLQAGRDARRAATPTRQCRRCSKEHPAFSSGRNGLPQFYCSRQCKEDAKKARQRRKHYRDDIRTTQRRVTHQQRLNAKARAYDILMVDVAHEVAWWQGVLSGNPTPFPEADMTESIVA